MSIEDEGGEAAPEGGPLDHFRTIAAELERNQKGGYCDKVRYRIVFKEAATPFYEIDNIEDVLLVIKDALRTLRCTHKAGWVHRVFSIGNVYLYKDPVTQEKKGIIGDFEYTIEAGTDGQRSVRTKGTPDFMAVEVANQLHIVINHGGKRVVDYRRWKENRKKTLKSINTSRGIYYNYIHDLESIWWIAVWALFNFEKRHARADEIDLLAAYERKINRDLLFSGIIGNLNRNKFFRVNSTYTQATRCLPKYFDDFSLTLMTIAEAIKDSYVEKELCGVTNISWDEKSTIHDIFIELLDEVEMGKFEIVYIQTPTTGGIPSTTKPTNDIRTNRILSEKIRGKETVSRKFENF
ncbi:other 1 kinase [Pyrrhoderma noxium]|uniref:Other 1 kinase n=1 Tax=Pyrrhoderma noxium TaxID=2282107 RepID=A0A286UB54_9AGAM|nr:other 1 kinase [Pyrrhoderma noxium]